MTDFTMNTGNTSNKKNGFIASLKARVLREVTIRRTDAKLRGLSDRDLTDIGIMRQDIRDVATRAISL